ncbi:MAG: Trm112 family protein [Desulfovibrio sp.]
MPLDEETLALLVCPQCKGELRLCPDRDGLLCAACSVVYPVRDDIPVMLVEESIPEETWQGSR